MNKARLIILLSGVLAGCSVLQEKVIGDHTKDYQKQSQTIPDVKPEVASDKKVVTEGEYSDFYPVSTTENVNHDIDQASLAPPESKIAHSSDASVAVATPPVNTTLNLLVSSKKAWEMVGSAIQKAGYEVLDQDKVLQVYYVLDTSKTAGKINSGSPIYQIQLMDQGAGSQVMLLDEQNKPLATNDGTKVLTSLRQHLAKVAS